jgi:hypothetical protein
MSKLNDGEIKTLLYMKEVALEAIASQKKRAGRLPSPMGHDYQKMLIDIENKIENLSRKLQEEK